VSRVTSPWRKLTRIDGAGGGAVIQQFGWYVLKTKANREGAVERSLSCSTCCCSLRASSSRCGSSGQRQKRVVPMFPTYLFVRANLERLGQAAALYARRPRFPALDGEPQ